MASTGQLRADTIVGLFRDNVSSLSELPALRYKVGDEWKVISWGEYGQAANEVTAGLAELGVELGERVGILSTNRPAWHIADMAIMGGGGVTVPVYPTSAPPQVAYILHHADVRVVFLENRDQLAKINAEREQMPQLVKVVLFDDDVRSEDGDFVMGLSALRDVGKARLAKEPTLVDERAASVKPENLATLVYTSGTTGPPKGAMLSHANIVWTIDSLMTLIGLQRDRFISFLPLSHIAERTVSNFCQIAEGGETWFARSVNTVAEDMPDVRPTVFFAVPRVWQKAAGGLRDKIAKEHGLKGKLAASYLSLAEKRCGDEPGEIKLSFFEKLRFSILDKLVGAKVRHGIGLDQARMLVSGAAAIHPNLLRFFAGIGLPIAEVYGQTEGCGPTTLNPPNAIRIGTVGPPIPGVQLRIEPEDGEILVKGGNVCMGYFKDDVATKALIDEDGWMHTGDVGVLDRGYLRITDRKKDLIINAAGKNIAPQEIESRFKVEPLISQAVVIGEGKKYLTALITLDADGMAKWATERGKPTDLETLVKDPDVVAMVDRIVKEVNSEHAPVEQIKKWQILPREFSIDDGEITPTLKVRRSAVNEKWSTVIDSMYD